MAENLTKMFGMVLYFHVSALQVYHLFLRLNLVRFYMRLRLFVLFQSPLLLFLVIPVVLLRLCL